MLHPCVQGETQTHRYARCDAVMHTWEQVRDLIVSLDPVLLSVSNKRLLHLDYPKVRRENDILWLLGVYLEYVECEVIRHDNRVTSVGLIGYLRYRKLASRDLAIPNLGFIQGIDQTKFMFFFSFSLSESDITSTGKQLVIK